MNTPICWDGVPPSTPRHTTQVFTVPKGSTVFCRFLGDVQGVWLHWLPTLGPRERSLPHLEEQCPHCPDRRLRWKGYAPAERWCLNHQTGKNEWQAVVLEITEEAMADLEGRELRGLVVEMKRQGDRVNSILRAEVIEDPTRLKRLGPTPAWFDVRPILERLWGMRQIAAPTALAETSGATDEAAEPPDVLPFPSPSADETPPAKPARRKRQ